MTLIAPRACGPAETAAVGALRDGDDPHALALRLGAPALFDPGEGSSGVAVVPLAPRGRLLSREGRGTLSWCGVTSEADGRGLDRLRELLAALAAPAVETPGVPLAGGLTVALAYDLAHEIERLPRTTEDRDGLPWLEAVACPASLVVDLGSRQCALAWLPDAGGVGAPWGLAAGEARQLEARVREALQAPSPATELDRGRPAGALVRLVDVAEHARRVAWLLEQIRAGEVYQANLSQRLEVAWEGSALALHRVLRRANPSPRAGWLRGSGWELVSNSPETLVTLHGRELASEPIAGTVALPEGPATPPERVAALASALEASAKDRAEHVMIVDIHRNDVGRASEPGTLRVASMMRVDRRSHVLQAVADVRGRLRDGADAVDVIEALFPGGCVTGVPKIRCMELLDEVERVGRGPYTGSFGWISASGDLELDVLIRSAWRVRGRVAFAAGGGVVLDSDPWAEHAETEAKAAALAEAIESLRE